MIHDVKYAFKFAVNRGGVANDSAAGKLISDGSSYAQHNRALALGILIVNVDRT